MYYEGISSRLLLAVVVLTYVQGELATQSSNIHTLYLVQRITIFFYFLRFDACSNHELANFIPCLLVAYYI
jgi:hypothetical protein